MDAANLRLAAIMPVVRCHGNNYERHKFALKLAAGTITLAATATWLGESLGRVSESTDYRVCFRDIVEGVPAAYVDLINVAVIDLVANHGTIPETLLLDSNRIKALNSHLNTDVVSAVIITTVELLYRRLFEGPTLGQVRVFCGTMAH
jgi:hypothetical protein